MALCRAAGWTWIANRPDGSIGGLDVGAPLVIEVPSADAPLHEKLAFLGDLSVALDARIYVVSEFPGGVWRVRLERADHISADEQVRELVHATLLAALAIATDVPRRRTT